MEMYEFISPCHFGMEAVLKREVYDLGYDIVKTEDGRVTFEGDAEAVCRANIHLRTAERVLLKAGEFRAETFDELFEAVKALPWERYLPEDARFWVAKASSVRSKLFSPSDIQSVVKKAIVERLKSFYGISWFPETGAAYPLRVFLNKDVVTVGMDTSGDSLHKRGYRILGSKAPIAETLAAAIILLTPWKGERILVDPFCGSGTIPIEAAMIAAKIAPGMNRTFTARDWTNLIAPQLWEDCFEEAEEMVDLSAETHIQGYDIDGEVIRAARDNAGRAGVDHMIHFQQRPVRELNHPKKYGFVITNPPYGERLEEKAALPGLYREIGQAFGRLDCWSEYLISSYEDTERYIGKKADKKRKIYNGMLRTTLYQFPGPKPPKRSRAADDKKQAPAG